MPIISINSVPMISIFSELCQNEQILPRSFGALISSRKEIKYDLHYTNYPS